MQLTNNYGLPQYTDPNDRFNKEDLNVAFKKIDDAVGELQDSINVLEPTAIKHIKNLSDKISEAEQVKVETEQLIQSGGSATKGEVQTISSQLADIVQQKASKLELEKTKSDLESSDAIQNADINNLKIKKTKLVDLDQEVINSIVGNSPTTSLNKKSVDWIKLKTFTGRIMEKNPVITLNLQTKEIVAPKFYLYLDSEFIVVNSQTTSLSTIDISLPFICYWESGNLKVSNTLDTNDNCIIVFMQYNKNIIGENWRAIKVIDINGVEVKNLNVTRTMLDTEIIKEMEVSKSYPNMEILKNGDFANGRTNWNFTNANILDSNDVILNGKKLLLSSDTLTTSSFIEQYLISNATLDIDSLPAIFKKMKLECFVKYNIPSENTLNSASGFTPMKFVVYGKGIDGSAKSVHVWSGIFRSGISTGVEQLSWSVNLVEEAKSQGIKIVNNITFMSLLYLNVGTAEISNIKIKLDNNSSSNKTYRDKTIITIGDSYTRGNKFQQHLISKCGFGRIKNVGVNGKEVKNYSEEINSEILSDVDFVHIMGGSNDLGANCLLGTINDTKDSNTFYGYVKKIIELVYSYKPSVRIIFTTQSWHIHPTYPNLINANGTKFEDMQKAIKEVCRLYRVPCFDWYSICGINEFTKHLYLASDLWHPSEVQFEMMGKALGEFINSI